MPRCRCQVDHAQIDKRAVKAAFPLRGRSEIGVAAMPEKAGAGGEYPVERQTGLLQDDGAQKRDIQVRARPGKSGSAAAFEVSIA